MKNSRLKLLIAIVVFCILIMMPMFVNAADNDIAIVKTGDKNYLIYVNENLDEKFKFALSSSIETPEANLNFINSSLDQDKESPKNVAYITEKTYSDKSIYMWIRDAEGKVTGPKTIELTTAIDKGELEKVEEITKKISVDTTQEYTYPEQIIDGYKYNVVTGEILITDSKEATYYYEQTPIVSNEKYKELMDLAELIQNNFDGMTIIEKINTEKEFFDLYNDLITKATWNKVVDMTIPQPLEAQEEDKYVVFLKKVDSNGEETLDAQFMTCKRKVEEGGIEEHTEKRNKIVEQTSKLPITYDSIVLFVVLGVIILAIIFVILRKRSINKDAKH